MMTRFLPFVLLLASLSLSAQEERPANAAKFQYRIFKTDEPIKVDGILDEAVWQQAEKATNFQMSSPVDDQPATHETIVQLTYNDQYIYVAATCLDDAEYVIQTLKRDQFTSSDEFGVFFDPIFRQTNGFGFGTSVMNAQSEALITAQNVDDSWDQRWFSSVHRNNTRWTVEMAIPFKSLRFEQGQKEWGMNFTRIEPGSNEENTWAHVPRQFSFSNLGYYGTLIWDNPPPKQGANVSVNPYVSLNRLENAGEDAMHTIQVGGDAKVGITSQLNLDLTVYPDFSQVDVDQQVTNLTRFNIFFPERRNFFLENGDIFNDFGAFGLSPFYSRRIGLNNAGEAVPIKYGARLSGNVTDNTRIGAFNIHQEKDSIGQNYSAAIVRQSVFKNSLIKGIFLNRQGFEDREKTDGNYGRNAGGEFRFATPDNKWATRVGYMHSLKEGITDKNGHKYGAFSYAGQRFRTFLLVQNMPENYYSDMGFVGRLINFDPENNQLVRVGFTQMANNLDWYTFPENNEKLNFHWSGLENYAYWNADGSLNEWYMRLRHFLFFKNTSQLRFRLNYNYVNLNFPFAITTPFLLAKEYHMKEFNIQYNSDIRKLVNWDIFAVYGDFYDGRKLTITGGVNFRVQPWGNFSLGLEQNSIWWDTYENRSISRATLKTEISFAQNLFWTTFLQFNTQSNNFNINSRVQWRFAPMSDVYLVYTDNYGLDIDPIVGANDFFHRNRSVVLRVNYWLTL